MDETVRTLVFFCFISVENLKMGIQEQRDKTVGKYGTVDKV